MTIFHKLFSIAPKQKGFTLIEVLVAMAITAMIGVGLMASTIQMLSVSTGNQNHVTAVKQVENAAYWIGRDVQMAQDLLPDAGSGFPLNISWKEWDGTTYQVCYTIVNGELTRASSINGGTPQRTVIANNIDGDPAKTNCQFNNGAFLLQITASIGGFRPATETRQIRVIPSSAL